MIHTLIIRPSRVELVLKTFSSDYNKLSEKKLISKEFTFRFNREIIDTGAYYKSFYRILADILQPYKKDIKQLQVSLRSSFFQVRSIQCEESMYSDQEYLNWEVDKTINDVSEHFNYGTFYEENIKTLHLFIMRKSVEAYFADILRKIISDDINFSVGYDFITDSKENVFVSANKLINKPFGSESSSIKMWNIPTEKIRSEVRYKRTLISTIVLSLLLAAFYLTYFQSESLFKLYTNFIDNEKPTQDTIAKLPKVKKDTVSYSEEIIKVKEENSSENLSSEEKFLEKLFEDEKTTDVIAEVKVIKEEAPKIIKKINIHDALDSLVSYNPSSVIFENGKVHVQFFNKRSLNKFMALTKANNILIIKEYQEYLSFEFEDKNTTYLALNKKDYKKARKTLKLDSKKPFIVMSNKNKFYKLTNILMKNNKIFDKFVLSNRGNKLFLAVYFD
ncbi:MAG: hypothetical protein PF574_03485 [Candidatus Delongbacteria bacterium]|jgi:hypothetical protein|nr:hypothetical protein [Candidatus Delongbacteria bacterium]